MVAEDKKITKNWVSGTAFKVHHPLFYREFLIKISHISGVCSSLLYTKIFHSSNKHLLEAYLYTRSGSMCQRFSSKENKLCHYEITFSVPIPSFLSPGSLKPVDQKETVENSCCPSTLSIFISHCFNLPLQPRQAALLFITKRTITVFS